jgi:hypothetical protein
MLHIQLCLQLLKGLAELQDSALAQRSSTPHTAGTAIRSIFTLHKEWRSVCACACGYVCMCLKYVHV